jgi:hypothetical protein
MKICSQPRLSSCTHPQVKTSLTLVILPQLLLLCRMKMIFGQETVGLILSVAKTYLCLYLQVQLLVSHASPGGVDSFFTSLFFLGRRVFPQKFEILPQNSQEFEPATDDTIVEADVDVTMSNPALYQTYALHNNYIPAPNERRSFRHVELAGQDMGGYEPSLARMEAIR